ncbi:MAG TPA: alpha-amylase family protein [Gemmatimonadaceae bacterium]|nr:alpha-amylase family protein [Gemmatimonadaceae bacterium]
MIDDLWYKNAVIYSLDLETFMDSGDDGVGDFEGLMRRLDYLETLGVDAVWLAPFQPTPNRDNGYDVCDYYGVDPRHGSSGDFVEFMHQAGIRGIRVLIDLVVNHTSTDHRWFQHARADPDSRYRDWYVWSDTRPPDWNEGMVFPGVEESTWSWDEVAHAWYYHRFYHHQPDLDTDNPEVRAEIRRIMGYWLQLGVAGFRLDAVPFLIESKRPGHQGEQHFDYLYEMHRFLEWRRGDAVLLGEANVLPEEARDYFGPAGEGMHLMFNFWVNQHLFYALATCDAGPLVQALEDTREVPEGAQWAHFLRNHDELDLGRLTEEQREAVFARYGPDPDMQLYHRGLRRRLAPMLGDRRHLELAYSLLFALPGTPVIRYGDEIGMGEDLSLTERDSVRTPMQWSDEPCGGFTRAAEAVQPVISGGEYGYERVNVAAQQRDPSSLLRWTQRMIHLRQECPEVGWGTWRVLPTGQRGVLALRYTWRRTTVVTLHNLTPDPCEVRIHTDDCDGNERLLDLIDRDEIAATDCEHHIVLEGHGFRWYRVGSLNYALYRGREWES